MSEIARKVFDQDLIFSPKKHVYTWAGAKVPGVTTVLGRLAKPFLIQWAADMSAEHFLAELAKGRVDFEAIHDDARVAHAKKRDASGDSGTNIHEYAECIFKGLPLPELRSDQAKRGAEAFHKWFDSNNIEVIASEKTIFSKQYYYAGTCDFVARINGELVVGDFKTGKRIYDETRYQTAAYQHALEEEEGIKFAHRLAVRFCKETGDFETKIFRDFESDFEVFAATLIIHRAMKKIEEANKAFKKRRSA